MTLGILPNGNGTQATLQSITYWTLLTGIMVDRMAGKQNTSPAAKSSLEKTGQDSSANVGSQDPTPAEIRQFEIIGSARLHDGYVAVHVSSNHRFNLNDFGDSPETELSLSDLALMKRIILVVDLDGDESASRYVAIPSLTSYGTPTTLDLRRSYPGRTAKIWMQDALPQRAQLAATPEQVAVEFEKIEMTANAQFAAAPVEERLILKRVDRHYVNVKTGETVDPAEAIAAQPVVLIGRMISGKRFTSFSVKNAAIQKYGPKEWGGRTAHLYIGADHRIERLYLPRDADGNGEAEILYDQITSSDRPDSQTIVRNDEIFRIGFHQYSHEKKIVLRRLGQRSWEFGNRAFTITAQHLSELLNLFPHVSVGFGSAAEIYSVNMPGLRVDSLPADLRAHPLEAHYVMGKLQYVLVFASEEKNSTTISLDSVPIGPKNKILFRLDLLQANREQNDGVLKLEFDGADPNGKWKTKLSGTTITIPNVLRQNGTVEIDRGILTSTQWNILIPKEQGSLSMKQQHHVVPRRYLGHHLKVRLQDGLLTDYFIQTSNGQWIRISYSVENGQRSRILRIPGIEKPIVLRWKKFWTKKKEAPPPDEPAKPALEKKPTSTVASGKATRTTRTRRPNTFSGDILLNGNRDESFWELGWEPRKMPSPLSSNSSRSMMWDESWEMIFMSYWSCSPL